MLKKFRYLFFAILLSLFFINVEAASHDVVAKFEHSQNVNLYSYELKTKKNRIILDNYVLELNVEEYEGIKAMFIKPEGEAYNWIKNISNNDENYYLYFEKNEKKVDIKYSIRLIDEDVNNIEVYNTDGKLIYDTNNTIDLYEGDIYFCVSEKHIEKKDDNIYLDIVTNNFGKVLVDGILYSGKNSIEIYDNNLKIAIIPDYGYKIKSIIYNKVDITKKIENGFIEINAKDNNLLEVTFEKNISETTPKYSISGKVMMNERPVSGATVTLSNGMYCITDEEGYYNFDNVSDKEQGFLVTLNGRVLGYISFLMNEKTNELNYYQGENYFTIESSKTINRLNIDLNIFDDYTIELTNIHEILEEENNYTWINIIVLFILLLSGYLFYRKHKKQ